MHTTSLKGIERILSFISSTSLASGEKYRLYSFMYGRASSGWRVWFLDPRDSSLTVGAGPRVILLGNRTPGKRIPSLESISPK